MNDLIAKGIILLSTLGTIVVMLMIIRKERKSETRPNANKNSKKFSYETSRRLHLD